MNWPTMIVLLFVAAAFAASLTYEVKKKKAGKSACGGNCGNCSCGCGK